MISDSEQTIGSTLSIDKMQNGRFRLFKKCSRLLSRGRDNKMAHKLKTKGRTVADAVLRLSQHVHEQYPQAVMTTLEVPYTDEDLTIEVALPEGYELRAVSDDLIRTCLAIEDDLGIAILTQVTRRSTEQRAV